MKKATKKKASRKTGKARQEVRKKNAELTDRFQDCLDEAVAHFLDNGDHLEVNFPTGQIRTLDSLRPRWPYLSRDRVRTVACAIQLCDVNRLFLNTVKVGLTAGAMWEWHVTLPVIAVIETLCYEVVQKEEWASNNVKFKKCIDILHSRGVFKHPFHLRLHELRDYRNNVHLYIHKAVQMAEGKPKKYNQAVLRLEKVEDLLRKHYGY